MQVKYDKPALLTILRDNLRTHNFQYQAAFAKYLLALREEFSMRKSLVSDAIVSGELPENFSVYVNLSTPQSHHSDYQRAIRMVEASSENEPIVLNEADFSKFVEDNWDWKQQFVATNSTYGV